MTPADIQLRLTAAQAIAREAGALAADFFRNRDRLVVEHKGVQDVVSLADRAAEDLIVGRLSSLFPDDGVLGEEGGARAGRNGAVWVIDPIDGTDNFLRGIPHWCISIGLVAKNDAPDGTGAYRSVAGVIHDPIHEELFAASAGGGATLNGKPIQVSGRTDPTQAKMGIGYSYRRPHAALLSTIDRLLSDRCEYTRLASGALGMAYTACGRVDGYWEAHINSWDVAAGLIIVEEAGGRTNAFLAGDGLAQGNVILAATPALYEFLGERSGTFAALEN